MPFKYYLYNKKFLKRVLHAKTKKKNFVLTTRTSAATNTYAEYLLTHFSGAGYMLDKSAKQFTLLSSFRCSLYSYINE